MGSLEMGVVDCGRCSDGARGWFRAGDYPGGALE